MKSRPVGAEFFHADGETDGRTDGQTDGGKNGRTDIRHDEANYRFSEFCESV